MDRERMELEVKYEVAQLRKLGQTAERLLHDADNIEETWRAAAAAKYIADLTLANENLCRRRYRALGAEQPSGRDSHRRMLEEFLAIPVIAQALHGDLPERLRRYLAFRHRFVHGYGFDVRWQAVQQPLVLLRETAEVLADAWLSWMERPE